jgi:hypothetical protein
MFVLLRWIGMLNPLVEFTYNATRARGIGHTPFKADFGFFPEELHTYSSNAIVNPGFVRRNK